MSTIAFTSKSIIERIRPFGLTERHSEIVRQFTPNWFAMTMGTGIVFLVLLALPFQFPGQHQIAQALWCFD